MIARNTRHKHVGCTSCGMRRLVTCHARCYAHLRAHVRGGRSAGRGLTSWANYAQNMPPKCAGYAPQSEKRDAPSNSHLRQCSRSATVTALCSVGAAFRCAMREEDDFVTGSRLRQASLPRPRSEPPPGHETRVSVRAACRIWSRRVVQLTVAPAASEIRSVGTSDSRRDRVPDAALRQAGHM
jgi:hypothetical protein